MSHLAFILVKRVPRHSGITIFGIMTLSITMKNRTFGIIALGM
jgi:hypothetical protein